MARVTYVDGDPGLVMMSMPRHETYCDPRLEQYARTQYQEFMEFLEQTQSEFMRRTVEINERMFGDEAVARARAVLEESGMIVDDAIYNPGWDNIFEPGMLMRRYILANPRIYDMYERNRISGYMDDVNLDEENVPPEWRDDYLFAVDEIMQWDKDTGEGYVIHASLERENPLSVSERMIIQDSWYIAEEYLNNKIDPTDPDKKKL